MYDLYGSLFDLLSFDEVTKQLLRQLFLTCNAPLSHSGPVTINAAVHIASATFNNTTNLSQIFPTSGASASVHYAVAQANHVLDSVALSKNHYVMCKACTNYTGAGVSGSAFKVYLPSKSSSLEPNVTSGTVVSYITDPSGNKVAVGSYLDHARGKVMMWWNRGGGYPASNIPYGWAITDGLTNTSSGVNVGVIPLSYGRCPIGVAAWDHTGQPQGADSHTHTISPHAVHVSYVQVQATGAGLARTGQDKPKICLDGSWTGAMAWPVMLWTLSTSDQTTQFGFSSDTDVTNVQFRDSDNIHTYHPDHHHNTPQDSYDISTHGPPLGPDRFFFDATMGCGNSYGALDSQCGSAIQFNHTTIDPGHYHFVTAYADVSLAGFQVATNNTILTVTLTGLHLCETAGHDHGTISGSSIAQCLAISSHTHGASMPFHVFPFDSNLPPVIFSMYIQRVL